MGAFGSKQVVKKNKTVVEPIKVNLPNANNYRPQNENLVQMLGQIEDSINNNNMKNAEEKSDKLRMELAKRMFETQFPHLCPKKGGAEKKKKSQKQNKSITQSKKSPTKKQLSK